MSSTNKFLSTDEINVSNGTVSVFGSKIGATNLISTIETVKVNSAGCLYNAKMQIDDTAGLQTALDNTISNPLTADLDANENEITNAAKVEITNTVNSVELNYATGNTDIDLDMNDVKIAVDATINVNPTTSFGQTDFDGDVTIADDLQIGGALIGELAINDINFTTTQTDDLKVEVTNAVAIDDIKFATTQSDDLKVEVTNAITIDDINFATTQTDDVKVEVTNAIVIDDINFATTQTDDVKVEVTNAIVIDDINFATTQTDDVKVEVTNAITIDDINFATTQTDDLKVEITNDLS
ncbi:MAG: hypothetical protein GY799_32810, partial [Desulfobulbaceae bacterium]|nr:hypothetical protein [Desulfobulbaceae bacterium]